MKLAWVVGLKYYSEWDYLWVFIGNLILIFYLNIFKKIFENISRHLIVGSSKLKTQSPFACSKLTKETIEQGVKYV